MTKHLKRKRAIFAVCLLAAVLLCGMYTGYWVEQHWKGQETIFDTVVAHDADEERPGEATPPEGQDRDTGILPEENCKDLLTDPNAQDYFEITEENADGYTGLAFSTEGHSLARGSYTVTIDYHASQDGSYASVYLPKEMDSESVAGETGSQIAEVQLPAGQDQVQFSFSLSRAEKPVEIRIYYGGGTFQIRKITTAPSTIHTDQRWNLFLLVAALGVWIYLMGFRYGEKEKKNSRIVIFVLTVAMLHSCLPLMNDFIFYGQDLKFHLGRLDGIAQALENGQFPMYLNMTQQNGYGEATPIMYPQLFLYLPALFICAGMSLLNAYKLLLAFVSILGILIAYFSFKGMLRSRGATLSAALAYQLCIYRLCDIYTREALGEALAMCFLPLVFYGFYEIYAGKEGRWILLVLGMTGILSSHVLTTMITVFVAGVFFVVMIPYLWKHHGGKKILALIKAFLLTLLLNLYFLVPLADCYLHEDFLIKQDSTSGLGVNATGVYLSQLFGIFYSGNSDTYSRGYGQTQNEMALSIGLLLLTAVLGYIWLKTVDQETGHKQVMGLGAFALAGAVFTAFLSLWLAPWQGIAGMRVVNKLKAVQMVWRFLAMTDLFASVVLGCVLLVLAARRPEHRKKIYGFAIALAFICSLYYMDTVSDNRSYYNRDLQDECSGDTLYLYSATDLDAQDLHTVRSTAEGTKLSDYQRIETTVSFSYVLPEGTEEADLAAPLYYFPGYTAYVNGERMSAEMDDQGLVSVHVTAPSGTVVFRYEAKTSWKAAEILSLIGWLALAGYGLGKTCRRKRAAVAVHEEE